MITQRRKSTVAPVLVGQPAVVEDLEEEVPDRLRGLLELVEQDDGERVLAHRGDRAARRRSMFVSARSRSWLSGVWYSLMSSRTSRSAEPKRNSASALAISVLPVPVGPTKRKTASGRLGSVRPALTSAIRSTRQSIASGWPSTRARRSARTSSRSSGASGSRIASGSPEARAAWRARRRRRGSSRPFSIASSTAAWRSWRALPGAATPGMNCCASSRLSSRTSVGDDDLRRLGVERVANDRGGLVVGERPDADRLHEAGNARPLLDQALVGGG